MNVYVSLGIYAFQSVFLLHIIFCVLYIVAILSLVLVHDTSVFIYWYCHLILF